MSTNPTPEQRANVERWVAALRSGKYQQGRNALRNEDRYCCLGVACDLFDAGRWRYLGGHFRYAPGTCDYGFEAKVSTPPVDVCRHFGFSGAIIGNLTWRNDRGRSFPEIADYIERELLGKEIA